MGFKIIFFILLSTVFALRTQLHGKMKRYSSGKELAVLAQKQDTFKKQLLEIRGEITEIDKILANQNASSGYQLTKLLQTMADERDSLYKMQQDLILPFNLMKCQCLGLTDQKKSQIKRKIDKVQTNIDNLEDTVMKCNQCPDLDIFMSEIAQSRQYLTVINQTINSECCWAPKTMPNERLTGLVDLNHSFYKNNMNAKNWYYGSQITEEQYRYKIFLRSTQYNLTACPIDRPFVNEKNNSCFGCSTNGAYNIGNKSCTSCKPWQFFDLAGQMCQPCGEKQVFNGTLNKCTRCPEGFRFDNKSSTGCSAGKQREDMRSNGAAISGALSNLANQTPKLCPRDVPFLNPVTNQCQQCRVGSMFSKQQNKCIVTNYIGLCPQSLPHFNIEKNQCQVCPKGTGYNPQTYHCQNGFGGSSQQNNGAPQNNTQTNNTQGKNKQQPENPASKCLIDQTYDKKTKKCVSTKTLCTKNEYYNSTYKECLSKSTLCQVDQVYDQELRLCKKVPFITSPYVFNLLYPHQRFTTYIDLYRQSKEANSNLKDCPMSAPFFSPTLIECISCPQENPLFNLQSGRCQSCPHPTSYNPSKYLCQNMLSHKTQTIDSLLDQL